MLAGSVYLQLLVWAQGFPPCAAVFSHVASLQGECELLSASSSSSSSCGEKAEFLAYESCSVDAELAPWLGLGGLDPGTRLSSLSSLQAEAQQMASSDMRSTASQPVAANYTSRLHFR